MKRIKAEFKNITKYISFYEMIPFAIITNMISTIICMNQFIMAKSIISHIIIAMIYAIILSSYTIIPFILKCKSLKYVGAFENKYERTLLGFSALTEKGIARKINKAKKHGWYYDGFGGLSPLRQVDAFPDYLDTIW